MPCGNNLEITIGQILDNQTPNDNDSRLYYN
jgi:hypothetical protein